MERNTPPAGLHIRSRAFVIFFLSSIVPLGFVAYLADIYVLPSIARTEGQEQLAGMTLAVLLMAVLALLAHLVLGKAMRDTVAEIQGTSERLQRLLDVAGSLSATPFTDVIRTKALEAAGGIVEAEGAFLFPEAGAPQSAVVGWGVGADELLEECRQMLASEPAGAPASKAPSLSAFSGRPDAAMRVPIVSEDDGFGTIVLAAAKGRAFAARDLEAVTAVAQLAATALQNASLREAQKNFFTHVTALLVEAVDRHQHKRAGHSERVAHYAGRLARGMGLGEQQIERLYFAALLHDLGMLRISPGLTDAEGYREHARFGHDMVAPITLFHDVAPIILHHHERYDGEGYPDGLRAEAIPLEARIIAVADAFDSMTAAHSYRPRVTVAEASRELKACAGKQFDPGAVATFVALLEKGDIEVEA